MRHVLSVVVAAATVAAMASVDKVDVASFDIEELDKDSMNDAFALVKTPAVSNMVTNNFNDLVNRIFEEEQSLVEIYASVSTGGSSNVLNTDFSSGFSKANNGGTTFSASSSSTGTCHHDCHGDCHGNHSSRGWR